MRRLLLWVVVLCGCVCPPPTIIQAPTITQPGPQPPEKADPETGQPKQPKIQYSLEEVQQEIAALKLLQSEIAKQEAGLLESIADGDKYHSLLGEKTRTKLKAGKFLLAYISSLKEDLKRRLAKLQEIEANLPPQD